MSGTTHAERELRRLRECTDNPIVRIDAAGNVVVANAALESLLGIRRAHILGYPAVRFLTRESLVWIEGAGDEPSMGEVAFIRDDGSTLGAGARVEHLATGEVELLVGASVEVSAALVELHGKAGIGSVAAEVAHEINNHLLVLGGYAQLMPLHIRREEWAKVDKAETPRKAADEKADAVELDARVLPVSKAVSTLAGPTHRKARLL